MANDEITHVVYRGGPYDGTTGTNDPLTEFRDLSFDTDDVFRYRRSTDVIERVHDKLSVVYQYEGQVLD